MYFLFRHFPSNPPPSTEPSYAAATHTTTPLHHMSRRKHTPVQWLDPTPLPLPLPPPPPLPQQLHLTNQVFLELLEMAENNHILVEEVEAATEFCSATTT
jgi:hypothetical protein